MALREVVHWFVGACLLSILLRTWLLMGLVVPVIVAGDSMQPTLARDKRILVDRTAYFWQTPRRGDVVVFRCPERATELCVKRVFGLPGEHMTVVDGQIRANGMPTAIGNAARIDVRYRDRVAYERRVGVGAPEPIIWKVNEREYFVVGDHAEVSHDSRDWPQGPGLPERLVVGRVVGVR